MQDRSSYVLATKVGRYGKRDTAWLSGRPENNDLGKIYA
jgi:hypothetical protein